MVEISQTIFLNALSWTKMCFYTLIRMSLNVVPECHFENKSALVRILRARHKRKILPETMLTVGSEVLLKHQLIAICAFCFGVILYNLSNMPVHIQSYSIHDRSLVSH